MTPGDPNLDDLFEQFGDVLGDFFGGGATRGPDLRMELELDREDLVRGETRVKVERFIGCLGCHGSGRARVESSPCPSCEGKGKRQVRRDAFMIATTCSECGGTGSAVECEECAGTGGETQEETLKVALPPGLQNGQTLRLRGKGSDRSDGKGPGDLYLAIRIPSAAPATIPVRESAGASMRPARMGPFIAFVIAVLAIVIAALLLR